MPKHLIRFIALLVIPALILDPAWAGAGLPFPLRTLDHQAAKIIESQALSGVLISAHTRFPKQSALLGTILLALGAVSCGQAPATETASRQSPRRISRSADQYIPGLPPLPEKPAPQVFPWPQKYRFFELFARGRGINQTVSEPFRFPKAKLDGVMVSSEMILTGIKDLSAYQGMRVYVEDSEGPFGFVFEKAGDYLAESYMFGDEDDPSSIKRGPHVYDISLANVSVFSAKNDLVPATMPPSAAASDITVLFQAFGVRFKVAKIELIPFKAAAVAPDAGIDKKPTVTVPRGQRRAPYDGELDRPIPKLPPGTPRGERHIPYGIDGNFGGARFNHGIATDPMGGRYVSPSTVRSGRSSAGAKTYGQRDINGPLDPKTSFHVKSTPRPPVPGLNSQPAPTPLAREKQDPEMKSEPLPFSIETFSVNPAGLSSAAEDVDIVQAHPLFVYLRVQPGGVAVVSVPSGNPVEIKLEAAPFGSRDSIIAVQGGGRDGAQVWVLGVVKGHPPHQAENDVLNYLARRGQSATGGIVTLDNHFITIAKRGHLSRIDFERKGPPTVIVNRQGFTVRSDVANAEGFAAVHEPNGEFVKWAQQTNGSEVAASSIDEHAPVLPRVALPVIVLAALTAAFTALSLSRIDGQHSMLLAALSGPQVALLVGIVSNFVGKRRSGIPAPSRMTLSLLRILRAA